MDLYPRIAWSYLLPLYRYCLPRKENTGQTCLEWSIEKIASANWGWTKDEIVCCTMQLIANVNRLAPIVNV